jgi:signal peptidase II
VSNVTSHKQNALGFLWLSVVIVLIDLASKFWVSSVLTYNMPVELLPIFDLRLLHNTGAAFSFLAAEEGWQRWLFVAIAIVVSLFIVRWLKQTDSADCLLASGYSLILGGALGNLFDRIVHGHVVDFFSVHYQGWYFPAFNVADIAITLGAAALIADALGLFKSKSEN